MKQAGVPNESSVASIRQVKMNQTGLHPVRMTLLLAAVLLSGATPASAGFWLDQQKPTNWNKPGAAVPKTRSQIDPSELTRCKTTLRPATSPEDRQVTQAGWKLFGSLQVFGSTTLVRGLSGFDGMCRPRGYQEFVFVDGKFAGTLSPSPMDSRTDGATGTIYLFRATNLNVEFSRYKAEDPLCCPSSKSMVDYQIERRGSQPLVVPTSVTQMPLR